MTKVSDTKKLQSVPSKRAIWLNSTSDQPTQVTQVTDKTVMTFRNLNKEIVNLKKDLRRSRFLIQCVKVGRGYFTILREESAMKKRQQQLQKLREEELNKFQPAKKFSDTHFRRTTLLAAYEDEKMRKVDASIIRPFSPVYSSIISSSLPESHVEPLYRQLCALHWLLEALTIDYTHHTMKPLIACWNPKDPGGSKSAIRKINKEKSMGQRWDHFVTAPKGGKGCGVSCQADKLLAKLQSQDKGSFLTDTKKLKVPAMRTASRRLSRRGSTLSLSRTSGASSPQSSMLSVNPGSDEPPSVVTGSKDIEDNESSSTKPEEETLHAHLQKLLEMVREDARRAIMMMMQKKAPSLLTVVNQVKSDYMWKEWQSTHRHSERSSTTSGESHIQVTPKKPKGRANRDIIQCKSGVCDSMRAKFYSIAQEAGFCLQDKMEILTKRQEERGLQKFQSFVLASNFQKDLSKMRHQVPVVKGDAEEIADHWYFDLLSKLPEDLKNFRPAKKVLTKLQKFGENLDLRIRPHVLLKVLQDLRIWELCSPDIAVAIEFVREHIIHMPSNDYVNWLQGRVNMPIQQQAHPT